MKFIAKPAGVYKANCYIVYDEKCNEGFIIDPGGDSEDIIKIIKDDGLAIRFIILTHGHFDHTGAVNKLKSALDVPVFMNEKDAYMVSGEKIKGSHLPSSDEIEISRFLKNGDELQYGDEKLQIIETPGHTQGGLTVFTGGCLFTGDTLFDGSVGRWDLPGGSKQDIINSIKGRLLVFPDSTGVYPGHGPSTTIGNERVNNPFL